jgi:2-methylisocitrate lyase-like PEP mutase family enzyme
MNAITASRRLAFRQQVAARKGLLTPGAFNAMSARVAEDLGFGAVYLTGAAVTNISFGLPDLGLVGLSDMAEHVAQIRDAVDLPMVVDADTGFGNVLKQPEGRLDEDPAIVAPFGERHRLVNRPIYDELDAQYKDAD